MGCIGLDVGNEFCRVGIARQGGIDIFLNEESTRETPAMITFGSKERFIGTAAAASAMMNLRNTVWQIKRLIGKKFRDPEVQSDLKLIPCTVTEGRDGWPLFHVIFLGEKKVFRAPELLGMILAHLKKIAKKSTGLPAGDCVIGIPAFMDDAQRRGYLDAAAIGGLRPLKLIHETTAAALAYGLFKLDLPPSDEVYVVFVDVGHAHTQVAVAALRKGQVKILSYAFDRCLGGRDFDEVLFNHFTAQFAAKYRIDVLSNPRACQRLRAACEKLKKILSANAEAPLSIECLMDEKDVKGFMTREEFEKLSAPLLQRLRHTCERAVADSELAIDNIYAVEVIGSGSRVPAVSRVLVSAFRKEPRRTLNASESVARGCALQGAMLSPTFRVRQFEINDYSVFPISFFWYGPPAFEYGHEEPTAPSASIVPQILPNSIVFPKGISFPVLKDLTFSTPESTFEVRALYGDMTDLPASTSNPFARFMIGPWSCRNPDKSRLRLSINLNLHGVLTLLSATLIEDEALEVSAQAQDSSKEVTRKRKIRHTHVPVVELPTRDLSQSELKSSVEKEFEMQFQDRLAEETKDVKNALEGLVYDMRNKFYGKLQEYASEAEKKDLLKKLQDTEAWLYEEGDNETKGVYSARLADLKQHVHLLEERQEEQHAREAAWTELLNRTINLRSAALAREGQINSMVIEKVLEECHQMEQWVRDARQRQDMLPRYAKPAIWASEIKNKCDSLESYCKSILNGDIG